MNKSEKLKSAILENYKSIREFSKVVDIPNSTIVSAIDNGIGGMAVDKVIKMCEVLNLDVVTFDNIPVSKDNLTNQENLLLSFFNKLNDIGQQEATKRVEELTYIDKYNKQSKITPLPKNEETPDYLLPDAASEIKGASEEDKQHDDDGIMNDPNF